ncbi:MAG: hypothetical protein ACI915_003823 [Gammaproteobacteria bacterium]|jgi:hypothetical protein
MKGTIAGKPYRLNRTLSLTPILFALGVCCYADELKTPELAARCSAYFFMAANTKSMGQFNDYYSGGEYAYNGAVNLVGADAALSQFNEASSEIIELIDRKWTNFGKADERYGVICADILREANNPDRIVASPR